MPRLLRLLPLAATIGGLFALGLAPSASAACLGADLPYSSANEQAMTEAVRCLVNVERTARGLPAVASNSLLDTVARAHSADMAANNYFSHDSQDGTKFSARMTAGGYDWVAAGENIAAGYRTAKIVMTGWMASKGHCENILNGQFAELGVGVVTGAGSYGIYWTQDFGRRTGAAVDSDAASGCPFSSLSPGTAPGGTDGTGETCGGAGTVSPTVRISSLRRAKGGKVRIAGSIAPDGCCQSVRFTVKRGTRSVKVTRTICGSKFVTRVRIPKARGNVRVTVSLGNGGPSAKRTLKL